MLGLIGLQAQASEAIPFTHESSAADIAALLGTDVDAIVSRMHPPAKEAFTPSSVRWFGTTLERRHIEATIRRFAPHSLEHGQHYRAAWTVRLLDFCPDSLELLISECPNCYRPLRWRGCSSLLKCGQCGASLLGSKSQTLKPEVHEEARLGAALVSSIATVRQAALASLPEPFSTWAPADALVGLLTLGHAQLSLGSSAEDVPGTSSDRIAAGLAFARDWPESMASYAKAATHKYDSTSIRAGLGPLGKLFEGAAKRNPVRELVRSTISISMNEARVPAKVFPGTIAQETYREGMFTAVQAAKFLGIDGKYLRRLEGRSQTFISRHNVKGGVALYSKEGITRIRKAFSSSFRGRECARDLGVPIYCLDALVGADLLQEVADVDAAIIAGGALYSKASIATLRAKLRKGSCRVRGAVSLEQAMCRHGHPQEWVAVFEAMLAGDLPFKFSHGTAVPISCALMVHPSDIDVRTGGRYNARDIKGINVACQVAARILGTTAQFISAAVQEGLIAGTLGTRNSALPLSGVLKFQQQFVLTEELCSLVGGDSRAIAVHLRRAGYAPAHVINRVRVWRRREINTFLKRCSRTFP